MLNTFKFSQSTLELTFIGYSCCTNVGLIIKQHAFQRNVSPQTPDAPVSILECFGSVARELFAGIESSKRRTSSTLPHTPRPVPAD